MSSAESLFLPQQQQSFFHRHNSNGSIMLMSPDPIPPNNSRQNINANDFDGSSHLRLQHPLFSGKTEQGSSIRQPKDNSKSLSETSSSSPLPPPPSQQNNNLNNSCSNQSLILRIGQPQKVSTPLYIRPRQSVSINRPALDETPSSVNGNNNNNTRRNNNDCGPVVIGQHSCTSVLIFGSFSSSLRDRIGHVGIDAKSTNNFRSLRQVQQKEKFITSSFVVQHHPEKQHRHPVTNEAATNEKNKQEDQPQARQHDLSSDSSSPSPTRFLNPLPPECVAQTLTSPMIAADTSPSMNGNNNDNSSNFNHHIFPRQNFSCEGQKKQCEASHSQRENSNNDNSNSSDNLVPNLVFVSPSRATSILLQEEKSEINRTSSSPKTKIRPSDLNEVNPDSTTEKSRVSKTKTTTTTALIFDLQNNHDAPSSRLSLTTNVNRLNHIGIVAEILSKMASENEMPLTFVPISNFSLVVRCEVELPPQEKNEKNSYVGLLNLQVTFFDIIMSENTTNKNKKNDDDDDHDNNIEEDGTTTSSVLFRRPVIDCENFELIRRCKKPSRKLFSSSSSISSNSSTEGIINIPNDKEWILKFFNKTKIQTIILSQMKDFLIAFSSDTFSPVDDKKWNLVNQNNRHHVDASEVVINHRDSHLPPSFHKNPVRFFGGGVNSVTTFSHFVNDNENNIQMKQLSLTTRNERLNTDDDDDGDAGNNIFAKKSMEKNEVKKNASSSKDRFELFSCRQLFVFVQKFVQKIQHELVAENRKRQENIVVGPSLHHQQKNQITFSVTSTTNNNMKHKQVTVHKDSSSKNNLVVG